jgi:DNA-binding response OmpR family regulator
MGRVQDPQRILVVDDEEDTRSLIAWVLRDLGYAVDTAPNGLVALERIEADIPQVVVLDLVMPQLDGWGFLGRLRVVSPLPPVVIMSARGDSASFARAVREGVAGYLFKPFKLGDLVTTCERLLKARDNAVDLPGKERRREPRRPLALAMTAHAEDKQPLGWCTLVDVSRSGAQLDLESPVELGECLRFHLRVPDRETPYLTLRGRVQWRGATQPGFCHGLIFEELAPDSERRLQELLRPN